MSVTERIHSFGESGSLTGIVTLPSGDDGSAADSARDRPFVVILNSGLVHRIGPFRLAVDLARRLAAAGFRVLRFDQAGIGDSPSRSSAGGVEERAVACGLEAMRFLEGRYGARTFAPGGLCTGAMNAHRLGLADERVTGMWLIDGYAYATLSSRARRVTSALRRPSDWPAIGGNLLSEGKARLEAFLGAPPPFQEEPARDSRTELFFQDWPPREEVRAELTRMLQRGARFLFVYTGGWCDFVDEGQFDEMFPSLPWRDRITVDFQPNADHTFFSVRDREALFPSVERFLSTLVTR